VGFEKNHFFCGSQPTSVFYRLFKNHIKTTKNIKPVSLWF
jgi:hypothetical protein